MQNPIDNSHNSFNFNFTVPLAFAEEGPEDLKTIEKGLHDEGIFIFSVFTNPTNPFFIEVQKQMYLEDPKFKIKLIILGIRYHKEFRV